MNESELAKRTVDNPEKLFVEHLLRYHRDDNRKALAELRGLLRGQPRDYYAAGKHVVEFLETLERRGNLSEEDDFRDNCYYQIGALFAYAHEKVLHRHSISFGTALRHLRGPSKDDPLDARLLALLNCRRTSLFSHLRQLIGLMRNASGVELDWEKLLSDAKKWNYPDRRVQRQWVRDYYKILLFNNDITISDSDVTE